MRQAITATYRDGVFYPDEPCDLPEGTTVRVAELSRPPLVSDPEERRRILKALVDRMAKNPISADAPKLTREDLHERG